MAWMPDDIPASQRAVRERCRHPSGIFHGFPRSELERSICDRFHKQVENYPDRTAVHDASGTITYAELNQTANQVAHAILARQTQFRQPVAFLAEQGIPSIVAIMGILKSGNFYIPLDPTYPKARIAYMLEDSTAEVVVTNRAHETLARRLSERSLNLVTMEDVNHESTGNPALDLGPNDQAYIMYTSGSTGHPRGVVENHRGVLHQIMRNTLNNQIGMEDRLSHARSCSFNGSIKEVFGALLNGAAIYSYNLRDEGIDGLTRWLIENRITVWTSVATPFRQFLGSLTGSESFPELRLVYIGGEAVHWSDVSGFKRHFSPSCIFSAGLGLTETAGTVSRYYVDDETHVDQALVPAGYPAIDMEVLILDESLQPVAPGEIGEIVVRSEYLAQGYWRRPEVTASAFLPDPGGGSKRLYRTGDLGRTLPDGCLIHLGRKDFQVKIRGQRVEIGEIETNLRQISGVKDATVAARPEDDGEIRLVAYVVPAQDPPPTVSALRRELSQTLPDHMVPSAYVFMASMPQTPAGKVDRKALPEYATDRPRLDSDYVPPRTPMERELAAIWSEVLRIEAVGVHDSFSDLGGHSLLAGRVATRVQERFGTSVTLRTIWESATIAELALVVTAAQIRDSTDEEIRQILTELAIPLEESK